jgi:hypothetical protein
MYAAERHGLLPHLYADDAKVYGTCSPANVSELQQRYFRLQLNIENISVLWCITSRRQHQLLTTSNRIGNDLNYDFL